MPNHMQKSKFQGEAQAPEMHPARDAQFLSLRGLTMIMVLYRMRYVRVNRSV